jgi:hypothetical protein
MHKRAFVSMFVMSYGVGQGAARASTWMKGDLHVHSSHSTDAKDSPVAEIISKAEALGLDFLAITDHDNHVEGRIETWGDPDYRSSRMTLLYGTEWTTGLGHANIFGAKPFDYQPFWQLRDTDIPRTLELAHQLNLHFSVNHPEAKDKWEPGFTLPVDSTEVWTAVFSIPNNNRKAIQKWDSVLKTGRRLTARGGSDSHHQKDFESQLFNIGNPTTWVKAEDHEGESILKALSEGRVSLSYAPSAERLEFSATDLDSGEKIEIGDSMTVPFKRNLHFQIDIVGARASESYEVTIIRNGEPWRTVHTRSSPIEFDATIPGMELSYFRVELKGSTPDAPFLSGIAFGSFIALTNPIYFNY